MRDENALESALARPQQQKWVYGGERDVPALAAAYAFGLVRNHPYRDGNQRIGFLALATFLGTHGFDLEATDEEVVIAIVALASGQLSEAALSDWTRAHAHKRR